MLKKYWNAFVTWMNSSWDKKLIPPPDSIPQEIPDPIHSIAWCGGTITERENMFNLAKQVCSQENLSPQLTTDLLLTIAGESGFNQWCENHGNKNGTVDYGLCQFNDGTLDGKALWIGAGAAFKDKDEVLNYPAKCVTVMCREFVAGHQRYWMAYPTRKSHANILSLLGAKVA